MTISNKFGALLNVLFTGALLFFIISVPAYAGDAGSSVPLIASSAESSPKQLVSIIMGFLYLMSAILGIVFLFQGILKLIANSKNPNDPKGSIKSIFLTFIAAGIMSNIYFGASTFIASITGTSQFCFLEQPNMSGEVKLPSADSGACFNAESSEITKAMREKLQSSQSDAWAKFKERVNLFFAVVQVIGLYYFMKSLVLLKGMSDGREQTTFVKVFIMMIFSAIAMDLSTAIEIIINTFTSLVKGT